MERRTQVRLALGAALLASLTLLRRDPSVIDIAAAVEAEGRAQGRLGLDYSRKLWFKRGIFSAHVHVIGEGQTYPYHVHHTQPEVVVVLRGDGAVRGKRRIPEGRLSIREAPVGPGDLVFSPVGQAHEWENVGDGPLWALVLQAPPFTENHFLEPGVVEPNEEDFTVVSLLDPELLVRGSAPPPWARQLGSAPPFALRPFPEVPLDLRRTSGRLGALDPDRETCAVLLQGRGEVTIEGETTSVRAPAWIYAPRGGYVLEAGGDADLVVLEARIPAYDHRLFWR